MRLTFARHGESEANVQEVYWNATHGYGLTGKGKQQAAELAELLAERHYSGLYCSPVLRAVQTAQIVGRRLGLMPEIADGLREYNVGILEGRRVLFRCWIGSGTHPRSNTRCVPGWLAG